MKINISELHFTHKKNICKHFYCRKMGLKISEKEKIQLQAAGCVC